MIWSAPAGKNLYHILEGLFKGFQFRKEVKQNFRIFKKALKSVGKQHYTRHRMLPLSQSL